MGTTRSVEKLKEEDPFLHEHSDFEKVLWGRWPGRRAVGLLFKGRFSETGKDREERHSIGSPWERPCPHHSYLRIRRPGDKKENCYPLFIVLSFPKD